MNRIRRSMSLVGRRARAALRSASGILVYWRVAIVLAISGIASWPGRWSTSSLEFQIATNVFATVLMTPVLLFGVDRVLKNIERRSREPRLLAVRFHLLEVVQDFLLHASFALTEDCKQGTRPLYFKAFPPEAGTQPPGLGVTVSVAPVLTRNLLGLVREILNLNPVQSGPSFAAATTDELRTWEDWEGARSVLLNTPDAVSVQAYRCLYQSLAYVFELLQQPRGEIAAQTLWQCSQIFAAAWVALKLEDRSGDASGRVFSMEIVERKSLVEQFRARIHEIAAP